MNNIIAGISRRCLLNYEDLCRKCMNDMYSNYKISSSVVCIMRNDLESFLSNDETTKIIEHNFEYDVLNTKIIAFYLAIHKSVSEVTVDILKEYSSEDIDPSIVPLIQKQIDKIVNS